MSKLIHALDMLNYLSLYDVVPISDLSERLEISERSVQRLKDTLVDAGYDIETIMGPGGGYRLTRHALLEQSQFTMEERKNIQKGISLLVHEYDHVFDDSFLRAWSKLSSQIQYAERVHVPAFQSVRLNVDIRQYQTHLNLLETAIEKHRYIAIIYQRSHFEMREYRFQPYEMIVVNQLWYLRGYDEKNRFLSLKVNRIQKLDLLDNTFVFDENASRQHALSEFGYRIKPLQVKAVVTDRHYITEYIWGDDQNITWLDKDRFILEVVFANEKAAQSFVLQHGSAIEVLQPQSLRVWIRDELETMMNHYR